MLLLFFLFTILLLLLLLLLLFIFSKVDEQSSLLNEITDVVRHAANLSFFGRLDDILHLHGDHDDQRITGLDLVPHPHVDLLHHAGHGGHGGRSAAVAAGARLGHELGQLAPETDRSGLTEEPDQIVPQNEVGFADRTVNVANYASDVIISGDVTFR